MNCYVFVYIQQTTDYKNVSNKSPQQSSQRKKNQGNF